MNDWTGAMRANDFEAAWAISARDAAARDPALRDDPALPYHLRWVWDGTPPDGREVLVRCYHGLGDTIQFARYLAPLARRARRLTVEVQPELIGLLSGLRPPVHPAVQRPPQPAMRLVPFDPASPLPRAECDIEIMELAFALRIAPGELRPPYLHAAPAALAPRTVALCHRAGDWDRGRGIPASLLAGVCRLRPCITLIPEPSVLPVSNPHGCSTDVVSSAALLAAADLVITVDTMVAHLAGALGRPLWLLLKADADCRWATGKPSAWYPQARFYCQSDDGDWRGAIAAVERDLALLGA